MSKGAHLLIRKKSVAAVIGAAAIGASAIGLSVSSASSGGSSGNQDAAAAYQTTTPIKHVVVIYGENISFDHYFGTYPTALNPPGEPQFNALPNTPAVNGLNTALLDSNPNEDNPERLDPSQAVTCDQNHGYSAEESAFDGGLMDKFVQDTQGSGCTETTYPDNGSYGPNGIVMDYYDGNTVTAMWNYAQHFTLNDNSYSTQFGPSTPGALNVVSGQTHGAVAVGGTTSSVANGTDIGDQDPAYDLCSNPSSAANTGATLPGNPNVNGDTVPEPNGVTMQMTGQNIGNLLNTKSITWGWFEGGFTPTGKTASGFPVCNAQAHANVGGSSTADYVQHHEPFQYYESTSNPYHNSPASVSDVGVSDQPNTPLSQAVNHQYDISWFDQSIDNGNMPAVSYLKAPAYEDGHAGYSDPLDEQRFLVDTINKIEQSKFWPSTAIILAYDDSDGWYDHQMGPIIRQSEDTADTLDGPGKCGSSATPPAQNDRCGVGPRQPLLVISPWAKQNYVDSTFTEQASIVQFIENNWSLGRIGNDSADAGAGTLANAFDFNQSYGHAPAIILNDNTGEIEQTVYPDGSTVSGDAQGGNGGNGGGDQGGNGGNGGNSWSGQGGQGGDGGQGGQGGRGGNGGQGGPGGKSNSPSSGGSIKLPTVVCTPSTSKNSIVYTCKTEGGSNVAMLFRARLYRGNTLVSNVASKVKSHRVKFKLSLGRKAHAGRYTIRLSIDAGGRVAMKTQTVRLR
jgi:phospholipase C